MEKDKDYPWYQDFENKVEKDGFLVAIKDFWQYIMDASNVPSALKSKITNLNPSAMNLAQFMKTISTLAIEITPKWDSHFHQDFITALHSLIPNLVQDCNSIKEADGSPIQCLKNTTFQNWGRTVENIPLYTFFPHSKQAVQNIVLWARQHNKQIRVAGYRHTWSDLYSTDEHILISTLSLDVATELPASHPPMDPDNNLQGIQLVGTIDEDGITKGLCKIGSATTNEQFRRWCLDTTADGGNWQWTVPLNVIMVEITWGGSNAPICHGAGLRHQTLSDLVVAIEFVNVHGELQTVDDPTLLKAAAGCFGLLGVVTAITIKLEPMTHARMQPTKPHIALTIPPPKGISIPSQIDMTNITQSEMDSSWDDFVTRCEDSYYAEWFWFPYQQKCWVNTWVNDGEKKDSRNYPGDPETWIEGTESYLSDLVNDWLFPFLPGYLQAKLMGTAAMSLLPTKEIVTPIIDALHFRRGIQNMRVLDMEMEIPIPARKDDPTKPDWSICQRAWWDAIRTVYNRDDAPMRITLEMRIMGDSNITMAPQYGNTFGTCAIEVLTNLTVDKDEWQSFLQEILDLWTSYTDEHGQPLNVRPHWAKQWQTLNIRGSEINDYLRDVAYKDRILEFKTQLEDIATSGDYILTDLQQTFSNPLLNNIFKDVFD